VGLANGTSRVQRRVSCRARRHPPGPVASCGSTIDALPGLPGAEQHEQCRRGWLRDASIMEQELLNLCDTEGNSSNGGGTFDTRRDAGGHGKHAIRWVPDLNDGLNAPHRAVGAPGEIGSPLVGQASLWNM